MTIEIRRESQAVLSDYASIAIAFEIREVVDTASLSSAGAALPVRAVTSRIKDYDALPHSGPRSWIVRYDMSNWVFLVALSEQQTIAGAIVIMEPRGVVDLGGRLGNGLLWDLRVSPHWRRRGVGRALIVAAETVAHEAGARELDVETQDTNVPACRLYAACGYSLTEIQPRGYWPLTDEAKLMWTKALL